MAEIVKFPSFKIAERAVNQEFSSYLKTETQPKTSANVEQQAALEDLFRRLNLGLLEPYLRDGAGRRCGRAPECILALEYRCTRYRGFAAQAVWSDEAGRKLDQITMVFDQRGPFNLKVFASTLVHEMIHATQFRDGEIIRNNYHSANFRDRMKSIGLQTSKTGKPGGADIGIGMSHYIIKGGLFDQLTDRIIAGGFKFPYEVNIPYLAQSGRKPVAKKDPSKAKFYCPKCGMVARAKKTAQLKCGRNACANQRLVLDW